MPARVIAIGDIHGCSTVLAALLTAIDPKPNDTIIPLGDYVDRGPDSKGVLDQIMALADRCKLVPLLGNHEEMLLNSLDHEENLNFWLDCGGDATMESYGSGHLSDQIPIEHMLATDAFFIFLMVQFIRGIPKELDEAARIDGAGHPRIFLQIILPLMVPALATTAIFTFIWTWNDFFSQLIFLTKPELYTVPLALRSFEDAQSTTNYAQMFAMSVVSLIPIFLIFLFGQKFLIKGIATTGIK